MGVLRTEDGRHPGTGAVVRRSGLSVRLKLTLSYAGFLMLTGALLLVAVGVFLLRQGWWQTNESGAVRLTPGTLFLRSFARRRRR
ncbi:histidine kinase OS=Streptomyces fumanus OX=67302 GN=GCM10018772_20680 PE=4 SV=1 [Streptomyces fumanus]